MKRAAIFIFLMACWLPQMLCAETIYTWTDKNGVLRFSNAPPPEGITDYQITESVPSDTGNQRRSSYDQMVEHASKEAEAARKQREKEAAARAAEEARRAEEQRQQRIQTQRKRLEQQIEALKKRGLSQTFTDGMKQARIEALTKEIQKLEKRQSDTSDSQ